MHAPQGLRRPMAPCVVVFTAQLQELMHSTSIMHMIMGVGVHGRAWMNCACAVVYALLICMVLPMRMRGPPAARR